MRRKGEAKKIALIICVGIQLIVIGIAFILSVKCN